ncbi:Spc97/Spc98 [Penicillium cf. griseofulvum]|uniref:Spindle pole body component n=1 Tax=Penicillium cf. griseofulvum TaxID=2972120 RepID=A0A9W9JMU7_9EURO|nr:Spc97/Spc98 [Penicillium cf. griseofulvum]KAJ5443230.1 Spc97/Spc98 [Penicillium cf. griseofulvum]
MALAADLSTLADALIISVAKISPDQKGSARVQSLKRRVQGVLRTGSHTRTDQFAVAKQLEGLQEKFQILNRDELAEALQIRLEELETNRNSWVPEILSLLLQLSDRPADLSTVKRPEEGAKAPVPKETLSWSDLNAEGTAFSDEEIWEQVDFAGDSSDDDFSSVASDVSLPKHRPQSATTVDEGYAIPDEVFVQTEDEDLVASLAKAQFWRAENHQGDAATSRLITESQFARETIFMLQGLPTSIYVCLDDDFRVDRRYMLAHSSRESLASILRCFSEIGAKLNTVRCFTKLPQTIPYMQTFCRGLEERLLEFDRVLSQVQCKYLSAGSTVSLIQLLVDVRQYSHELALLAEMIAKLDQNSIDQPMRCLDLLYDLICVLEALGDESSSQHLAGLFFMCFKTYSSSIRLWMETGQVDASDSTFFVRTNGDHGDLRNIWHDWFVLDTGNRQQRIPQFLEASVRKVFTAGKSMVFLRHLNAPPDIEAMKFEDLYSQDSSLPFPALVESTFEKLVDVDHSLSASLLRTELDQQCGLWTSLDALQHVYLAKDMSAVSMVDAKIFELIDRGRSWDDRFLLTEISRTAFSSVSVVDTSRLSMRPASTPSRASQNYHRTVGILEAISIDYGLPWPIANIITEDAIHSYQRISTFLMQIRRAKYAIVRQRIRDARIITPDDNDKLVHALHHNMLWVLDFIYGHLTYLAISTETQSLHKVLSGAQDVDAMIAAHQSYMSSLEAQCLLSRDVSHIHDAIIKFLDLCIHYADLQAAHLLGDEDQHLENLKAQRENRGSKDEFDSDDDDDYDDMTHEHTFTVSFRDSTYSQQMRTVNNHFSHLASFITDGLKTLANADGLESWHILADRLEWRRNWRRL